MSIFQIALDWWAGKPAVRRHPQWSKESRTWLKDHPSCLVCGDPATVVHHRFPFHCFPELEMVPVLSMEQLQRALGMSMRPTGGQIAWMPVCEGEQHKSLHCHLLLHAGNFRRYIPDAPMLAAYVRAALSTGISKQGA